MDSMELISTYWYRLCIYYKFLCKGTVKVQNHLISLNATKFENYKSYKVKYMNQINRHLIIFFANSRISIFFKKLVGLIVNNVWKESIQEKGKQST